MEKIVQAADFRPLFTPANSCVRVISYRCVSACAIDVVICGWHCEGALAGRRWRSVKSFHVVGIIARRSTHGAGGVRQLTCRHLLLRETMQCKKGSPYSITERRVPELIPVLGSQPACDVSHKPGGRLPLLSARPTVTPATLKRAAANFAACEQRHNGCEQFA